MYKNHKIGVVVPAYNEQQLIVPTLTNMPAIVDRLFVVDDASTDETAIRLRELSAKDPRIQVITHHTNKGLGQSLIDGYLRSADSDVDITVVMAGDNQMDPDDLPALLDQIIDQGYDYAKGNRLLHADVVRRMPLYRLVGNSALTFLTKFATGFYFVMDPQCGYTAIRNSCLRKIPIHRMTKGYGYNADILCMLNIGRFKVTDVEVRPVYGDEKSKIKVWTYIPRTSMLLMRLFFRRLFRKYVVLDLHPLVFFYLMSFILIPLGLYKGFLIYYMEYVQRIHVSEAALILAALLNITGFQSLFFAIWFDSENGKRLPG